MESDGERGARYPFEMLSEWLQEALENRGMSQAELSRRLTKHLGRSVDRAAVNKMLSGERKISADEMVAISELLDYPAPVAPPPPTEAEIPVMGYVGAGAEVEPEFEQVPPDGLFQITVPFPMPADMIAYQVKGDSMLPQFHDGMIIVVFKEQRRSTDSFLGEEAVVRTADGRRFVKTIERSGDGGYTLRSWNAKPIERVSLDWVGEIFTYLPATSLKREGRRVEKQGGLQGQLKLRAG